MRRNWDIIRELLLAAEDLGPNERVSLSDFDESRQFEMSYHAGLLDEAGLVHASISKELSQRPTHFYIYRLTWSGHELLDAIRNESIWVKTKSAISERGGSMTFDIVKGLALSYAKSGLGI